jgi:signal transduction histidine kinase
MTTRTRVATLGWILVAGIFVVDLQIPVGYAGGMLYVAPVLLGLWTRSERYALVTAGAATVLTVVGFLGSPPGEPSTVVYVLNRTGAILAIWITAVGVTLQRRSERARSELTAELEAKNAELERFTYTVSHDLKSPLITIKGFLGLLEQDAAAGNLERLRADVARIGTAADTMKLLLEQLLELSRIGRVVRPPEPVPLGDLVREALAALDGLVRERGVEVVVQADLPLVHGDRVRLREVIQNLLENAIKFLGDQPRPRIEVGATAADGIVCHVRDNGVGIEPAYREKVFELFERLGRGGEGTGVGLALVKRIVEVHGGRAWAESDGPGTGSTFYFSLPPAGEERHGRAIAG